MAWISASPNPVGVYSVNVRTTTTVSWSTERSANGLVYVSENGAGEQLLAGQASAGAPSGDLPLEVKLGSVYRLSLKRAENDKNEIASAIVTTFDLRRQLAEGFAASYLPQLRPQLITHLVVKPGIDTVRISFRTTRPTIPTTEIRDDSGAWVDGRLPLFGGLQTRHEAVFGIERPLALNRKHSFRIEAFGPTGNKSSPNKAVLTGEFVTGVRNVDVMFESLDMHDDGDPDPRGAGEFRLAFGAGDAATGDPLGAPLFWGEGSISDEDPPLDLGQVIAIPGAPRQLWLQVGAVEDDGTAAPWEMGGIGRGMRPTFTGTGSSYYGDEGEQGAWVTVVADVDTDPGRWMIPFEMRTGDFPIDFVVTGHLGVHAFVGEFIAPKMTKSGTLPPSSAWLTEPGSVARLAVAGVGDRYELVALAADGSLRCRSLTPELSGRRDASDWTRVDLPGQGGPAVVAAASGLLDLVDLDDRGGVLHCRIDPREARAAKWRRLGGSFRHIVPAVETGRRGAEPAVILFGIDEGGHLHVRDTRGEGRDWDRLGDRPVRAIAPVSPGSQGVALFAIDAEGNLLHFAKRNGRWRLQTLDVRVPGESPAQLLSIVPMAQAHPDGREAALGELVIGVICEDRQVFALRWPDYPGGSPEGRWQEFGSLQDLLVAEEASPPKRWRKAKGDPK